MIAIDTSVVIASFGRWHEHHVTALGTRSRHPRLAAHTALEAYSVLTRLPEPFRADPSIAIQFLSRAYDTPRLSLDHGAQATAPERLHALGVSGGAVYDGLIALTAEAADAELLTLDRRALATYERCGVRARLLG